MRAFLATSRTSKFNITRRQCLHVPKIYLLCLLANRNPHERGRQKGKPTREKSSFMKIWWIHHENGLLFLPFLFLLRHPLLRHSPIRLSIAEISFAEGGNSLKTGKNSFPNIAEMLCAQLIISSMVCVFDFPSDKIDFPSREAIAVPLDSSPHNRFVMRDRNS